MFQPGDFIVNAANGVCKIEETMEMDLLGNGDMKPYFLLVPVGESTARVYIPVDTAESRIRKVISAEEALRVIDSIPTIEEIIVRSEKEREVKYKEAVRSCDPSRLFGIMKTLYNRKQSRLAQGKKSTAIDDRYFKMAESQLFAELAFVLQIDKSEVNPLIQERLALKV